MNIVMELGIVCKKIGIMKIYCQYILYIFTVFNCRSTKVRIRIIFAAQCAKCDFAHSKISFYFLFPAKNVGNLTE